MQADNSPGKEPATSPTPADLQRTVEEIGRMVHELRAAQHVIRSRMLAGTLAIVILLLAFGTAAYFKVRDNVAPPKLQAAIATRIKTLVPQLQDPLSLTLHDVVPYYMEMGRTRLQVVSPRLQLQIKGQAENITRDLEQKLSAQIDVYFQGISNRAAAQLTKEFPTVAADGGHRAVNRLQQAMNTEGDNLRKHLQELYDAQSQRIGQSLQQFPVPDVKQTSADTLQRQLLHHLLMLADYELTSEPPAPAAAPAANVMTTNR